jgi:dTMP kinase
MTLPGRLIVFCGIDGSGKSTQIKLLKQFLTELGYQCEAFKQPTPWFRNNELVRRCLDEADYKVDQRFLALLSAADRINQISTVIEPLLANGTQVLLDRYVYSSYAYLHARGLTDYQWLKTINKYVPRPDLAFYLDADPQVALSRILMRDGARHKKEEQNIGVMKRVRSRFLELAKEYDFRVLNGDEPVERLHQIVVQEVMSVINRRDL